MSSTPKTYYFKASIMDAPVPIWREFKISGEGNLIYLHNTLQRLFNWEDDHLFGFTIVKAKRKTGEEIEEEDFETTMIQDAVPDKDYKLIYLYDFGDNWKHELKLLKITEEDTPIPVCLSGAGAGPPEDCGGVWGYEEILAVINDPQNPDYEERRYWMGLDDGEEYDPNLFDLEKVNADIQEYPPSSELMNFYDLQSGEIIEI